MISITVSANESHFDTTCVVSTEYGKALKYKLQCSPPALGSYVRFTLIGENVTLVLCHVVIRTLGKSKNRVASSTRNKRFPPRNVSYSILSSNVSEAWCNKYKEKRKPLIPLTLRHYCCKICDGSKESRYMHNIINEDGEEEPGKQ